jgi:hypothetical protein
MSLKFVPLLAPHSLSLWLRTVYCSNETQLRLCPSMSCQPLARYIMTLHYQSNTYRVGITIFVLYTYSLMKHRKSIPFISSIKYLLPGLRLPPIFDNFSFKTKVSLFNKRLFYRTLSMLATWHYYAAL